MSTQKGRRNERKAREAYERAGWWVYSPENASYGDNDLWNLFDLAAINPRGPRMALVQVKTNSQATMGKTFHDSRPFCRLRDVAVHFLVKHDRKGWQLLTPAGDKTGVARTAYDEITDDRVGPNVDTPLNIGDGLTEWLS